MQLNEHLRKIMKILILAFLCAEMQTTFTHRELTQQRGIGSATAAGDGKRSIKAPYQASIRLLELERDYYGKGHICSGALVGPSVVITVAQCLHSHEKKGVYHPAQLRVVLGSSQRFAPTAHGQSFGVTHVYQPPKHLAIAILMLDSDVPAQQTHIQPIALPVDAATPLETKEGVQWHISSWGLEGDDGHELHELLKLPVRSSPFSEGHNYCIVQDHRGTPAVYELDAGAPLTKSNQLLGLRSHSTAYVDVASHVEWIQTQTGNGSNHNSSIWGILGLLVFTAYVLKCSHKCLMT